MVDRALVVAPNSLRDNVPYRSRSRLINLIAVAEAKTKLGYEYDEHLDGIQYH